MGVLKLRAAMAQIACLILGALLGFSLLEPSISTLLFLPAALLLLGLLLIQADRRTRLQRIGAFLLGGGIGGAAPLLALVVRIRNVCSGSGQVGSSSGAGGSYECYSIETLWALIPYGTVFCLGALLLFLAWRQRAQSVGP